MSRKALPSILLHKSEVTYRDTGVSKNGGRKKRIKMIKFDRLTTVIHLKIYYF